MQLINDIIDLLGDEKSTTQSALLKAQILAHRLGDVDLSRWVEHELRGYPESVEVPPYRMLKLTLIGHVTNGVYHYSNQTLPTGHLEEPLRTNLTRTELRDSVSAIEGWKDKNNVALPIPAEALDLLSEPFSHTYFVQQAWGRFSVGAIEQVLIQVRSRLLEFCLELSDRLPTDLTGAEVRQRADEVGSNDIFRNAVFGDNTTIVVGSGSIQDVRNEVVRNDLDSLVNVLRKHGISDTDLKNLRTAIDEDASSEEVLNRTLGPRVKDWIGVMMAKAGSTTWEISMGAAGSLLGTAISTYYGFVT